MTTTGWVLLIAANSPVYFGLGRLFFRDWESFWEAVGFWFTPDTWSAFQGDYGNDRWASLKLALWAVCCVGCVLGEAALVRRYFA